MSENPVLKKPLRMEAKIVVKVPGEASGRQNILNLLLSLGVISALPPDGGAAHAIRFESRIFFHVQSLLS